MAYGKKEHSRLALVQLDDSGGVLRNISTDISSVDAPDNADTADVTGFTQSRRQYVVGLRDNTITLNGFLNDIANTGVHGVLSGIVGGTAGRTFEFYPNGSASGYARMVGEVLCSAYSVRADIGGAVTFTATLVPADATGIVWGTA